MKKKHRGLISGLGLAAFIALSAGEVNAAPMTLTVFLNNVNIFSTTGTNQAVAASTTALNTALSATGYTFSSLGAASNFPGTAGSVGGFISISGNVSLAPGTTDGVLRIVVTESGFTAPVSGINSVLTSASTANYSGAGAGTASPLTASYTTYTGTFMDSTPITVDNNTLTQPSNGSANDSHSDTTTAGVPTYLTPYTLMGTTTIQLSTLSSGSPANNVFTGKTSIVSQPIPEPASVVMMLTGMPLPLVVMGLLRRRRGTA